MEQRTSDWDSERFDLKYRSGSDWGGHSGGGSSLHHTASYRLFLENFISLNGVRSVVDIGCGDWQFSRFINWHNATYLGLDIVEAIVLKNDREYGTPMHKFEKMPASLAEVPCADLLIIKDVLQHLSNQRIEEFLTSLLPKFKFALITNSFEKIQTPQNIDIGNGDFRCLDLTSPPFEYKGAYVAEFGSQLWERLRTLLVVR